MEHPHFIIAFTGNEQTGKEVLFKKLTAQKGPAMPSCIRDMSCPHGDFSYDSRRYKAVNLPGVLSLSSPSEEASCTASYLCSGHPDAILVIGHALHLEILLGLLKEILSLGPVRDSSIPVVLCVSRCEEARRQGIRIDFSLLHDVLQIPVVPLHGYGREQMDDLKAALHYALQPHHRHDFLYDCLDFSPCRLAHECMMPEISPSQGKKRNISPEAGWIRRICEALLLLLLIGLTACLSIRLTDCLWPLFFETETVLWAWAEWFGIPAWLAAPMVHGAFRAVSCTILAAFILGIFSHGMALPAMMMIYLKTGGIPSPSSPFILGQVLANHGWTWRTALCTCLMALTRFPSVTVCLKMRRRPGHTPYFFWGRLLVFILGITLCFLIALTGRISG